MEVTWVVTFCLVAAFSNLQEVICQPEDCSLLQHIVPNCTCEGAVHSQTNIIITCRHLGLTSMPVINGSYNGSIYEFTLAFNNIEVLPDDAFKGLRIERLDVTNNKLKNISETAFRGLEETLVELKLDGDPGSDVSAPFKAMSNLTNLQELTLKNFQVPNGDLEKRSDFQPFSKLTLLWLDSWDLRSLGVNVFIGLTSLVKLKLTKQKLLTQYPVQAVNGVKDTLVELEMTQTGITHLRYRGFELLKGLKTLKLSSNELQTLEDECFWGIENTLEYLDLSFNTIASQVDKIQALRGIKTLMLQNTGISSLSNTDFLRNKTNLLEVDFAHNSLVALGDNTFNNLPSVKTLDLSYNQISTMADNSLSGLTSLDRLLLDHQELVGGTLSLPSLPPITELVLTSTHLSNASWDKISEATTLKTLKMSKTITDGYIPDLVFQKLRSLETIDLSSNQISIIGEKTFVGPSSTLKVISLHTNNIPYFNSCTFYNYSMPITLDLSFNPLHCDCSLYWLRRAYSMNTTTFEAPELLKCLYPTKLNGTLFTQNSLDEFCLDPSQPPTCENYYTTTPIPETTTVNPTTTTPVPVNISVIFESATVSSITVSWIIDKPGALEAIIVYHSKLQSSESPVESRDLPPENGQYQVTGLVSDTAYEVCVRGRRISGGTEHKCIKERTKTSSFITSTIATSGPQGMSRGTEIGIIIGAVIGGLIVFAILVAIIYLLLVRKKSPKEKYPVQPRTFTPAELPSIGYDSKRYRKKKKEDRTDGNRNNMTVTVISDGQTSQPQVGRVSTGSYQYLNNNNQVSDQPVPSTSYANDIEVSSTHSPYENDVSLRPLPQMPSDNKPSTSGGYDNVGFRHSTSEPQPPHTYSEIKL